MPEDDSMRIHPVALSGRAALVVVAALGLCACGGSGSTTSTPPASHTTTTAATSASQTASTVATSTTSSGTTSTAASGPPPCRAAGLVLSFLGGQGATGHGELGFALRNTLHSSCSTIGYPGVQFLGRSGQPLPTSPTHTTDDFFGHSPLRPLVVGAGQTVSFRLGVTHGIASSAGCTTVHALQVIPPNDTASLRVSIPGGAIECGTVTVSPLRAGTSAYT